MDAPPEGVFEVFQILLQVRLLELGEELDLGTGVDPADLIDQLTFGHGALTFEG